MTKVPHSTGQTLTALCSAVESCGVVPTTEACVDLWEVGREEGGKYKVHIECLLCAQSLFPNYTFVLPENEATVRSLGQLLAAVAVQG